MTTAATNVKIDKVFVKMSTDDQDKSLATFINWPQHLGPRTTPPGPNDQRRVVALILHPHPKMGGTAFNNVTDMLSTMLSNGNYLAYHENNGQHGQKQGLASLYDVSHHGPRVQREDLRFDPHTNTYTSRLLGPLIQQSIPNVYDVIDAGEAKKAENVEPNSSSKTLSTSNSPHPNGIITVRFHTSGVEDSNGASTWNGATSAEVEDVVTILRWMFHPQSKIFPTDLFLIGYSFGSCILASALNRILLSNTNDEYTLDSTYYGLQTRASYRALSRHLSNSLRGTVFLAFPCGFFARVLLGVHISRLRSLSTYLMQEKQNSAQNDQNNQNDKSGPAPTFTNHLGKESAIPPMMYFVMDQDDELTGPQQIVNVLESLPYPQNDKMKHAMFQLLRTKTGHSFRGAEHILALLLSSYFCNSISYYDSVPQQQLGSEHNQTSLNDATAITSLSTKSNTTEDANGTRKRTSPRDKSTGPNNGAKNQKNDKSEKNNNTDDKKNDDKSTAPLKPIPSPPTTRTHNPSVVLHTAVYKDEFFRRYINDMNLWIPILIVLLIICKIIYSAYFEAHVRRELGIMDDPSTIAETATVIGDAVKAKISRE